MANHQCARFLNKPMRSHERAIILIARYLQSTNQMGVIFQPGPKLGLECFVDAYLAGRWSQVDADDPENGMSHTAYIIRCDGFPIGWCS